MDDVELVPLSGEAALGLTGPTVDEVLARVGLPVLSESMTSTRVEWNGMDLRIAREYGAVAAHYVLWAPVQQLGKLWMFLRTAGATPVGSASLEAFSNPLKGFRNYEHRRRHERDLPQELPRQMRAAFISAKAAICGQEIVERIRSLRGNTCPPAPPPTRGCSTWHPVPAPGTERLGLETGAEAGKIASAAERFACWPPGTIRIFATFCAHDSEPKPKPARTETFKYSVGSSAGTARILDTPASFQ